MNPINISDSEQYQGRPKKGRKRKIANQSRADTKRLRNTNKPYVNSQLNVVEAKTFDERFVCQCKKKCTENVGQLLRRRLFKQFWSMGTFSGRCAIIVGCVNQLAKKRMRVSRRTVTNKYRIYGHEVCKKTFLRTLKIDGSRVNLALRKQCCDEYTDERGKFSGGRNAMSPSQRKAVIDHIESFPKYVSHYCRKVTSAKFLSGDLCLTKMYELYKTSHEESISFSSYQRIFYNNFNLRFKAPKKDTCQRCDRFVIRKSAATGDEFLQLQRDHNQHLEKAEFLEEQMNKDLALAKTDPTIETLTFDIQKTHSLPKLSTNVAYYKRQLNLYNFGIHVGSTNKGIFNVWLEHEASKGTQEVGSSLTKYMKTMKPSVKKLILWSDACGGQNRSIKLILILIHALQNHLTLESISVRYRQPGHSFLPNDTEFGDVECKLKKKTNLYTASEYIEVMQSCRKNNPFEIQRMSSDDFFSSKLLEKATTNRKFDEHKQKISWLDTHEISIEKSLPFILKMFRKPGENFQTVNIAKRGKSIPLKDIRLEKLWPEGHALSNDKIKDLKELLTFIPKKSQQDYSFLNAITGSDFVDDVDGYGESVDFDLVDDE